MGASFDPSPPRRGVFRFLLGSIPTLLVLALAGAAGWYGHRTGWKLPKFSEIAGETAAADDWCGDHSVPESECVECKPDLLPRLDSRWCKLHGIHVCPLCNPKLAQVKQTPSVTPADRDRAKRALDFAERPSNSAICKLHERRIQFASVQAVDRAGIVVDEVGTDRVVEFVASPGEIGYDQTKFAHLAARSPGAVHRVYKHLGDAVKPGDVLAVIDAAEVGKAKAEFQKAVGSVSLKTETVASLKASSAVVKGSSIREAEAELKDARIRLNAARQSLVNLGLPVELAGVTDLSEDQLEAKLHFLGLPPTLTESLDRRTTTSNLLPMLAPMEGVIVSRDIVVGESVDIARTLFEVVDNRQLWITFDVKIEDAKRLKVGQPVRFQPDDAKQELSGQLAWVSTQADPKTRTVKVRADLPDPQGKLRANVFGTGRIILREEAQAVVVPNEAMHWEGCCWVVFVRDKDFLTEGSPKVFHTRTVRTGGKDARNTEVIAGVLPGEVVATRNSNVLRAELLRGSLGEG